MDDTELLELAERELAAAKSEGEKAQAERDAAQARLDLAFRSIQAWNTIVEQKRQVAGVPESKGGILSRAAELGRGARPTAASLGFSAEDEELPTSQTDFVRGMLKAAGPKGITPGQIREYARSLGRSTTANFPNGILSKLKERNEVEYIAYGRYRAKKP